VRVPDVGEHDATGAGAGDVFQHQTVEGFFGSDLVDVGESGAGHVDVRETEVAAERYARSSGDGVIEGVEIAGAGEVDAEEAAAGDLEIGAGNIFDGAGAADAGLDIDAVGAAGEGAVIDLDVADAAGGFAADAEAGEVAADQVAMGDADVLGGFAEAGAIEAATGFEADGIVAGIDVAIFDADVFAGVDIDAIAGADDLEMFDGDISAIGGVGGPVAALGDGEIFPADVVARDGFEDDGAARILRGGHGGISLDATGANDAGVIDVGGVDEGAAAGLPAAFPADVEHGVIVGISAADEDAVGGEAEDGAIAKLDASDEIVAGRHEDFATTGDSAGIQGFLEGDGIFSGAIAEGAEVADVVGGGSGGVAWDRGGQAEGEDKKDEKD